VIGLRGQPCAWATATVVANASVATATAHAAVLQGPKLWGDIDASCVFTLLPLCLPP
jgi:hypothetical protein